MLENMADFLADAGMQAEIWNKFKFTKERAQNVVDMINEILFQKLAEFAESLIWNVPGTRSGMPYRLQR